MALIIDDIRIPDFKPTSELETFEQNFQDDGKIDIQQPTELGEVLRELNNTAKDKSGMSGIDLRTRLRAWEIPPLMAVDVLVGMNFLPKECLNLTEQKKRLSVSLDGGGRNDIVKIVNGNQEQKAKAGGGMFNPKNWGNS